MIFTLLELAGAFVGGGVVGAGSWAAFAAKAKAEVAVLAADVKTEASKVAPGATALLAKIEALLAKL
jgi:hypothetical protein